jgi:hypothetical protein
MRIAAFMDMSFARRRKAKPDTTTPELPVLLAEISAKQGSSPTALTQSRTQTSAAPTATDPLIEIFAPVGHSVAATHRFSDKPANPVIPRKLI